MITLHHAPGTRSMRTLWLLHEMDIPFEVVEHGFDRSLRSPDFLALSPAGRVPALEIDGSVMFETGAITEYLCERFSPDELGRPPGHPERQDWLIWLHFSETISQHSAALTQQHRFLYPPEARSPVVQKLEAARVAKCFAALDARLATRPYLLDGGFTATEISCGQAVYMARHFAKIEEFAALSDWYARLAVRPAFQRSAPAPGQGLYDKSFYPVEADG